MNYLSDFGLNVLWTKPKSECLFFPAWLSEIICTQDNQLYPELHHKKHVQQGERGDCPHPLSSCNTPQQYCTQLWGSSVKKDIEL